MNKVSVLIPSYNLGHLIGRTIESVLAQTFTDFELIIEDDGSTDNSLDVIRPYLADERVALIVKAKNEGQNKTTNNLIDAAHGEYICCLPADDVIVPDKLERQVAYLDANQDCGIVFGWPKFATEAGQAIKYEVEGIEDIKNSTRVNWRRRFQSGNCLFIATSMYRRSLHDELGQFDEDLSILADLEWYVRITEKYELHVIQAPLATITIRDNFDNLSARTPAVKELAFDQLEIVRDRHWPVDRTKTKYLFATPFYEMKGYSPYIASMFQTVYALARTTKVEFDFFELSGDSYVWRARNQIVDAFMRTDATHLIFIDSDQAWSLEAIMRLLKADADVVGGAYPMKNDWEKYSVVAYGTPLTDEQQAMLRERGLPDAGLGNPERNEQGLIRAMNLPTGFMKIKREVFEKLKKAFPHNWYWQDDSKIYDYFGHMTTEHVRYGEDISFCRRWEMIGGKLWIEPRCDISHCGQKVWSGNYENFLRRQPGGAQDPKLTLVKEAA